MNLEQRVQALENEVAILKQQIQTTLLDIQSMLMTNAHPALRGESVAPAASAWDDETEAAPPAKALPVRKFSLEAANLDEPEDEPEEVPVRSVGRPAAKPRTPAPPPPAPAPVASAVRANGRPAPAAPVQPPAEPEPLVEDERMSELKRWVADKIDENGAQATIDELLAYSHSTYFLPEELNELINYAMSYAEDELAQQRPPVPPLVPPAPTRASAGRHRTTVYAQPSRTAKAKAAPHREEEDDGGKRKTLLRLIAGIQSAGTSDWGKK